MAVHHFSGSSGMISTPSKLHALPPNEDPARCAGVPYDLTPAFLDELFTKHNIDYVVHGDDPCLLPDGTDAYAHAKKQGRFRMVRLQDRGEGMKGWSSACQECSLGMLWQQ